MSGTEEDAANLQLRLAVKLAAQLWNMSERPVSMVRAVQRFRPELGDDSGREPRGRHGVLQLRLAVKQAAELWNMSQRSVSMVRAVQRFRPELAAEIAVGEPYGNMAYCIPTGRTTNKSTT